MSSRSMKENIVRKSILRNPEVPLQNEQTTKKSNKRISIYDIKTSADETPGLPLNAPRVNKLEELRKSLNEIKNFQAKEMQFNKQTQDFISRAVSSKLNFPSNQSVFKNLPKLEGQTSHSSTKSVQKVNIPKKLDSKNDIQKLLDELVEAEYRNEELNKRINLSQSYTDEFLGIKKFKEPSFKLPNPKTETQIYYEQLRKDLYNHLFASEDYLSSIVKFDPTGQPKIRDMKDKDCKCMSDFYAKHSMCS